MDGNTKEQTARELTVELIRSDGKPEKKNFNIKSGENIVNAGELKQGILSYFNESPLLEAEDIADENESFHLLGYDSEKNGTAFQDAEEIDLKRYSSFEISPRTTGGIRKHEAACY